MFAKWEVFQITDSIVFKVSFFDFLMEQLIDSVDEFTEKFVDCAEELSYNIVSNIANMIATNHSLNGVH